MLELMLSGNHEGKDQQPVIGFMDNKQAFNHIS